MIIRCSSYVHGTESIMDAHRTKVLNFLMAKLPELWLLLVLPHDKQVTAASSSKQGIPAIFDLADCRLAVRLTRARCTVRFCRAGACVLLVVLWLFLPNLTVKRWNLEWGKTDLETVELLPAHPDGKQPDEQGPASINGSSRSATQALGHAHAKVVEEGDADHTPGCAPLKLP